MRPPPRTCKWLFLCRGHSCGVLSESLMSNAAKPLTRLWGPAPWPPIPPVHTFDTAADKPLGDAEGFSERLIGNGQTMSEGRAGMQPRDLWSAVRIVFRAATALSVASLIVSNTLAFAQAELPRAYVDTTYAAPNVTPIVVNSGGDLQTALDTAAAQAGSAGSIVQLQNGAVFTGNFVLPAQTGTGWIYVVSSALANLPAGTRVSPAQASSMPRIESPNSDPALQTVPGTHHFRLVGVEVTVAPSVSANYALGSLGDCSSAQNGLSLVP